MATRRYHSESWREEGRGRYRQVQYRCRLLQDGLRMSGEPLRSFVEGSSTARPKNKSDSFHPENGIARVGLLKSYVENSVDDIDVVPSYNGNMYGPRVPSPNTDADGFQKFVRRLGPSDTIGFIESVPGLSIGFNLSNITYAAEVSYASGKPIVYVVASSMSSFERFRSDNIRAYLVQHKHEYRDVNDIFDTSGRRGQMKTFKDIEMFKDVSVV